MKRRISPVLPWILLAGLVCLMFAFSAQDGDASHQLSSKISAWIVLHLQGLFNYIRNAPEYRIANDTNFLVRKIAHIFLFFCVTLCVLAGVRGLRLRRFFRYALILLIPLGLACLDEFHQLFVSGRSGRGWDIWVDMLGVAAAIIFYIICKIIKNF